MKEILNIINQLQNTSGRNDKENILKNNASNETFIKVLKYTYNDNLQYGFSEKKLRELLKYSTTCSQITFNNGFDMLDKLAESNINDSLRNNVISFLKSKSEDEQELWIKILTKDLRCNISAKTINKAIKGLINTWEIQQAHPIDKVKLKKGEWIALSLKLNGIRSTLFKDVFRSRQNKEMIGYDHILKDIKSIEWLNNYVVDGELIRKNKDNISDNENFRLTTSIVNSDAKEKPEIEMVIFDLIPNDEFVKGESSKTFKDRLIQLAQLQTEIIRLGLENIRIAPTYYTGTDHSKIEELLNEVDNQGYEGLMCLRDVTYKTKRHNGILKCKKFLEADLEIIGYEEGEGKYKGSLGSFIVNFKGTKVNVGSGFSDEERVEYWEDKDSYIGRVLQVKYKEETMDKKTGLVNMQFPTKICVREIGKEVSYN
jgi:DNA ligase-1